MPTGIGGGPLSSPVMASTPISYPLSAVVLLTCLTACEGGSTTSITASDSGTTSGSETETTATLSETETTATTIDPTTGGPGTVTDPSQTDSDSDSDATTDATTDPTGINQAPIAEDDGPFIARSTFKLSVLAIHGLLANDIDLDNDDLSVVPDGDDKTQKSGEYTTLPNGSFVYTPFKSPLGQNEDYYWGDDSFFYTVTDGQGEFATAEVKIEVEPTIIPGASLYFPDRGGFGIEGEDSGDHALRSVSRAGDVNGDGLDDIVVAAPQSDIQGANSGRIYVLFGQKESYPTSFSLSALDGSNAGFVINGVEAGDYAGRSVAGGGDINGDGLADIIIGTPSTDTNGIASGTAYVVFGKQDTTFVQLANVEAGEGGFPIYGGDKVHLAGASVESAGDVNGDGYDDVLVGAPGANNGENLAAGRAYVVFGRPGGAPLGLNHVEAGIGGFAMLGTGHNFLTGESVSPAGDVNNDGLADVLVGAAQAGGDETSEGRAYVVFGKTDTDSLILDDVGAEGKGFLIEGEEDGDRAGRAVAAGGDINGDGYDDILVGSFRHDINGDSSGRAYAIFGKPDNAPVSLKTLLDAEEGLVIDGAYPRDYAGFSLAGAGDINGDGFDDILVGAYGASANAQPDAGRAYLVYGRPTSEVVPLSQLANPSDAEINNGFVILGQTAGGYAGFSVDMAGDFNGDGFDDILVGAHLDHPIGETSGRGYIIHGGNFTHSVTSLGSENADILFGTAGGETVVGGLGNDTLNGEGPDVLYGGAGDDTFSLLDLDFTRIDGGGNHDSIVLASSGMDLDLTSMHARRIVDVEAIDLNDQSNTVRIDTASLLALSSNFTFVTIRGGSTDHVVADFTGAGLVDIGELIQNYRVFTNGVFQLRVAMDITNLEVTL